MVAAGNKFIQNINISSSTHTAGTQKNMLLIAVTLKTTEL
jgi:hypothetical protein